MPRGLDKLLIGGLLFVLAAIPWIFRQGLSLQFASSYAATLDLRTTTERDDRRVARAFGYARAAVPAGSDATITYVPSDMKLIRKSSVRVPGASRDAALAKARSMSTAIASAFNAEGPGRLDTYVSAWVEPIPGDTSRTVLWAIDAWAGVAGLVALGLLVAGWRESRAERPDAKVIELPATLALIVLAVTTLPFLMPRWIFMALFAMAIASAIAARIAAKAREAQRAAHWPATEGRIVASKMPLEYAYTVNGVEYRGTRIGISDLSAGNPRASATLARYPAGRACPVYYDPANPADSLLDREPPARIGAMYAGAALTVLVALAVVVALSQISEIIRYFSPP